MSLIQQHPCVPLKLDSNVGLQTASTGHVGQSISAHQLDRSNRIGLQRKIKPPTCCLASFELEFDTREEEPFTFCSFWEARFSVET